MARVLIGDDDPLLRGLLQHKLSSDGHRVILAEDGGEVLALTREQQPDLIVLDAMMPVMDGFEVLRRLKADPVFSGIPVVMLTALRRETDVVGALQLGAADYLVKPFIPEELLERVRRLAAPQSQDQNDDRARRPR